MIFLNVVAALDIIIVFLHVGGPRSVAALALERQMHVVTSCRNDTCNTLRPLMRFLIAQMGLLMSIHSSHADTSE